MSTDDFCGLCGYDTDCVCAKVMAREVCGIRAAGGMVGFSACDLAWAHDGDQHASAGDGFYSQATLMEHRWRQKARRAAERRGGA